MDLVPDRLSLPRITAGADDEEVGVRADRPHVEDHHVLRQLLLRESGDAAGLFERAQVPVDPFLGGPKSSGR
jgi:hypothetical protein